MRAYQVTWVMGALVLGACDRPRAPPGEDVGAASFALASPPPDAVCLRITVVGSRTVTASFDITPAQTNRFQMSGLPLGSCSFGAEAFPVGCPDVVDDTPQSWVSEPVTAVMASGVTAEVALRLGRPSGRAAVSVDFLDVDGGAADATGLPSPFLLTTTCPVAIDSTGTALGMFDDVTEHSTTVPAVAVGSFTSCTVERTFARPIASIRVSILEGSTVDDTGFVGDLMVTAQHQGCFGTHDRVTSSVDVTSQVQVTGATVSFALRAQETCCCQTGWGDLAAASPPQGARMRWQVTLSD